MYCKYISIIAVFVSCNWIDCQRYLVIIIYPCRRGYYILSRCRIRVLYTSSSKSVQYSYQWFILTIILIFFISNIAYTMLFVCCGVVYTMRQKRSANEMFKFFTTTKNIFSRHIQYTCQDIRTSHILCKCPFFIWDNNTP